MKKKAKLWSITGLSIELGKDRPSVSRALSRIEPDGKIGRYNGYYLVTVLKAMGAWADRDAKSPRQRKLKAELALAKAEGKLVDKAAAERAIFHRARLERDVWQSWVPRIAPRLSGKLDVDQRKLDAALLGEVTHHLTELADTPMAELG